MFDQETGKREVQASGATGGRLLCVLTALLPVAGCVRPSERIATSLTTYGLDAGRSQCVGDRLERSLSIGQLQQLGRAARAYSQGDTAPGRLTVADLVRVSTQINDVRIPIEVGRAAAACGILGSKPDAPIS